MSFSKAVGQVRELLLHSKFDMMRYWLQSLADRVRKLSPRVLFLVFRPEIGIHHLIE